MTAYQFRSIASRARAKVAFGTLRPVPAANAERPLSIQSRDLRRDGGNDGSAPIPDVPTLATIEPPEWTPFRPS